MALRLKILVGTLLLSLTAFSQSVTSKDTSKVVLPYSIAKRIAIDLVQGDSVRAELTETQKLLQLTDSKVLLKDSIIENYKIKEINYTQQIALYKQKEAEYTSLVSDLEHSNKKLQRRTRILSGAVGTLVLTTLLGFLIP